MMRKFSSWRPPAASVGRAARSLARDVGPIALTLLGLLCATAAKADEWPKRLVLHPIAAPQPKLQYRLLPSVADEREGNAVVFYGRVRAQHSEFFTDEEHWRDIHAASSIPLAEIAAKDSLRLNHEDTIFQDLQRAARCRRCDWQYPIQEEGVRVSLPDAQEQRSYARLLHADIRWRVAHGDFDGAVASLQTGYAMARHTANTPLLVPGYISLAIAGMMSEDVLELIQQPGAPNLYWALTCLPSPFYDARRIAEGELNCIEATFPQLADVDCTIGDPEYWQNQLKTMADVYETYFYFGDTERTEFRQEMPLRLLRGYPMAKEALARQGWDEKQLASMPVGQVILLHTASVWADWRDEVFTAMALPFPEARRRLNRFEGARLVASRTWESSLPIERVIPAIACEAFMRQDRQIALLRVLEALRLHGAEKSGHLPATLAELAVPAPDDPMTGKPFEYQLREGVALISGPPALGIPFQYEVRLATPDAE